MTPKKLFLSASFAVSPLRDGTQQNTGEVAGTGIASGLKMDEPAERAELEAWHCGNDEYFYVTYS